MEKDSNEKRLYHRYASKVNGLLKDEEAKSIFDALKNGKNTYMRMDRVESSSFDLSWIENIERVLPDLGTIINNPRMVTKSVGDLVPVELAKKTNSESVQHLASHTQFIKDIDEDGNVIPNKILSFSNEDELKTYENRFIATLIRHLVLFVEKRYEYVRSFSVLHNGEQLYFKNKSTVNGADVEIETHVKVVSEKTDTSSVNSAKYVERIAKMREFILYYYNSKFMRLFKTDRDVHNPIIQTNIIRKNPLYHHCYELYLFMEAYSQLGVSYGVDEKYTVFDDKELSELNSLMLANYLALQGKDKPKNSKDKHKVYKPKILTTSNDEIFTYGPLLKGPIKFVRADAGYFHYLKNKIDEKEEYLPLHPSREEKAYFDDDYNTAAITKKEYIENVKLLARSGEAELAFDEEVSEIIEQRRREEELRRIREIQRRLDAQEEYLRKFRQRVVDDARNFAPHYEDDEEEGKDYSYLYPTREEVAQRERNERCYKVEEEVYAIYDENDFLSENERKASEVINEPQILESYEEEYIEPVEEKPVVEEKTEAYVQEVKEEPVAEKPIAAPVAPTKEANKPIIAPINGRQVVTLADIDKVLSEDDKKQVKQEKKKADMESLPKGTSLPLPEPTHRHIEFAPKRHIARPIVVFEKEKEPDLLSEAKKKKMKPNTTRPIVVFDKDTTPRKEAVEEEKVIKPTPAKKMPVRPETIASPKPEEHDPSKRHYIIKTKEGYYVSEDVYTSNPDKAKFFYDNNEAFKKAFEVRGEAIRK